MRTVSKRVMGLLLAIVMVIGILPMGLVATAFADQPMQKAPTKKGSNFVGEYCIDSGFETPKSIYGGKVQFTKSGDYATLTLENITLTKNDYSKESIFVAGIHLMGYNTTIILKGTNTIESPNSAAGYGLFAYSTAQTVTIGEESTGVLRVYCNKTVEQSSLVNVPALNVNGGTLIVDSNYKNMITNSISCENITVDGGKLICYGHKILTKNLTVNSGELSIPYMAGYGFYGFYGNKCEILITGGLVYVSGILNQCNVTITGGTATFNCGQKLKPASLNFLNSSQPDNTWYKYKFSDTGYDPGGEYTQSQTSQFEITDLTAYLKITPKNAENRSTLVIHGRSENSYEQGRTFDYKENETITLPQNPLFTPVNYEFAGYGYGSEVSYQPGDSYTIKNDGSLNAIFTPLPVITAIDTYVRIPRVGKAFDRYGATSSMDYVIDYVSWQTDDTVAKANTAYSAYVYVITDSFDGAFAENCTANVNGEAVTVVSGGGTTSLTLFVEFPAHKELTTAVADIDLPQNGKSTEDMQLTLPDDAEYTGNLIWKHNNKRFEGEFVEGEEYTAQVTLTAKDGIFVSKEDLTATLNGQTPDTVNVDEYSNTATLTKTFTVSVDRELATGTADTIIFGEPTEENDKILTADYTGDLPKGMTHKTYDNGITIEGIPTEVGSYTSVWTIDYDIGNSKTVTVNITVVEPVYHTVTYVDSLTGEVIATEQVLHGKEANFPAPPEHEGYEFFSWNNMGEAVEADMTITAYYAKLMTIDAAVNSPFEVLFEEELTDVKEVNYLLSTETPPEWLKVEATTGGLKLSGTPTEPCELDFYGVFLATLNDNTVLTLIYRIEITVTAHTFKLGDANGDGVVNTGDAVTILKAAAGMIELSETMEKVADVNKDGVMNTGDAVTILKAAAGMIELPTF